MSPLKATAGFAVWMTGLPSSGKSTIAKQLETRFRNDGLRVEVLDGDEIREHLSPNLGFTKADRDTHIRRLAYVGKLLTRNGVIVVAAAISPYRETRAYARSLIGSFVEVYINCPLEVCIERDVKGLYRKAIAGQIAEFTGISDPYEPPERPELEIRTDLETSLDSSARILTELKRLGFIID